MKNKEHTRSHKLNDNQFTVYFYNKANLKKKPSGCEMEEKSCLKASGWLELAGYLNLITKCL